MITTLDPRIPKDLPEGVTPEIVQERIRWIHEANCTCKRCGGAMFYTTAFLCDTCHPVRGGMWCAASQIAEAICRGKYGPLPPADTVTVTLNAADADSVCRLLREDIFGSWDVYRPPVIDSAQRVINAITDALKKAGHS